MPEMLSSVSFNVHFQALLMVNVLIAERGSSRPPLMQHVHAVALTHVRSANVDCSK